MKQNLKNVTCTVKELFDAISEQEGIEQLIDDTFYTLAKSHIEIQNENEDWIKINKIVRKKDSHVRTEFSDGSFLIGGSNHKLIFNKKVFPDNFVLLKDLHVGDEIIKSDNTKVTVTKKTKENISKPVYDFEVNSESQLYITANKLIHHNTPGIGKSMTVLNELEGSEKTYVHIQGGIKNARGLFMTLCDNNDPDLIVVFDDVNPIFKDKDCTDILRVAVSQEKVRSITFRDSKLDKMRYQYNSPLKFESKVIIITNIPKKRIDGAILSRTSAIEIIATIPEVAEYVYDNLESAPPENIPISWKKEIFNFIEKELKWNKVKHFDFRIFADCCLWYAANVKSNGEVNPAWKKYVATICL